MRALLLSRIKVLDRKLCKHKQTLKWVAYVKDRVRERDHVCVQRANHGVPVQERRVQARVRAREAPYMRYRYTQGGLKRYR